ncbi:Uncharacterized protein OBRU01_13406 [Operophtera brumata]|uniref:Thioesterase domain-containing protein n=1 Tax=Operophtera brumata TaxID=104452 RepID=A0A0L7L8U9_OPEBR|nr:Uncharacterized protein OBRU01_13406 [Operophtera brumata]
MEATIKFTSLNDKHLQATFEIDSSMCNGTNAIHGGYIASIIDVASQKGDKITVEVKTLKNSTNTPIMEACLFRGDGTVVAKGTTTFAIGNEQFQKYCAKQLKLDFMN